MGESAHTYLCAVESQSHDFDPCWPHEAWHVTVSHSDPVSKDLHGFHEIGSCSWHVRVSRANVMQTQKTQNICIAFVQCRPNVFDAGPPFYKCYTMFFDFTGKSNSGNCPVFCSATASSAHSSGQDEDRNQL